MLPGEQIQYLTDAGFVVVLTDYRLCPQVSLYEGSICGARDAYTWCKVNLPALMQEEVGIKVEPSRIVIFGHSAGGPLALQHQRLMTLSLIRFIKSL